jgi:F-type H+-transporting ATPase subunit gamma
MVERLVDIVTQIRNVRQLGSVVTAMRGIAASRALKGRSLLDGIDAYSKVIAHAIGQALSLLPPDAVAGPQAGAASGAWWARGARPGLILFCAEHGFAGAYSERVFDAAGRVDGAGGADEIEEATILIIGTRGGVVASERGIKPAWSGAMATRVEAIPRFADQLAEALFGFVASGAIAKVDIVFSRSVSGSGIQIDRHSLLPIDLGNFARPAGGQAPLTTLTPHLLLERLAAEYIYAQLCQAAMHAFEAENEARMMAMASAKTNIETKLARLAQRERELRQEEVTTEIVELVAGAEAAQSTRR